MIPQNIQSQITSIWDKYIADNKKVVDTKGNDLQDIDSKRLEAIETLKIIVQDFITGAIDIAEFKTDIDSFNKQNNLWGFTSIKGQMFFNLLFKTSDTDEQTQKLTKLMKQCVAEPKDLPDALSKIEALDKYVCAIFNKAPDKRKAPNPGSVCYFLSYFWQIHDSEIWPVMYSSMIVSFTDIGLWQETKSQKESYETFFKFNEEIKQILSQHTDRAISNWEAEHSFWNFRTVKGSTPKKEAKTKEQKQVETTKEAPISALTQASFDIYDYIPRVIANLIDLGNETEASSSAKGSKYEKVVCEVFKQLGFTVQTLGQGSGREPDLIAIHKEENVAFIVDAKAYSNGYMMGAGDERAIKDYINHYCPKLKKEGIQRIGFIIVSNTFKSNFEEYINDVTWKTDIKRFLLLSSDALLHLLAYRIKDQKTLSEIVEAIISLGITISAQDVIQQFDDI
ncbi:MAG TPA: restriction endonuclease FokI C-terminal domain-containing protein [Agriterribacter sp.]|nr:restriction endonuclease [Chitinophagaceae bacterium]HRP31585.1 restriction endonuclease FokI C-terminal domain-containing protein [Agriterribacter sp.]